MIAIDKLNNFCFLFSKAIALCKKWQYTEYKKIQMRIITV